jgi:hypothetical protein
MGAWPAGGRDVIAPVPSAAAVPCGLRSACAVRPARHAAMPALAQRPAPPGAAARPAPACRVALAGQAGWRDMSTRVSPPFWVMDCLSWTGAGTGLPVPVIISVASRQTSRVRGGRGRAWPGRRRRSARAWTAGRRSGRSSRVATATAGTTAHRADCARVPSRCSRQVPSLVKLNY